MSPVLVDEDPPFLDAVLVLLSCISCNSFLQTSSQCDLFGHQRSKSSFDQAALSMLKCLRRLKEWTQEQGLPEVSIRQGFGSTSGAKPASSENLHACTACTGIIL